jgi:hypothetical protein
MKMISLKPVYEMVGCKSSLGAAGKMPCPTYSIPASACKTGQKLAKVAGSTCSGCYADGRGNYRFTNVQDTLARRLESIAGPLWPAAMATLITRESAASGFFRWHDSGDLQSVAHLEAIAEVARRTPHIRHWLPTREYQMVQTWLRDHDVPANLTIRLSAHMRDGSAPTIRTRTGQRLAVSYVHDRKAPRGQVCPAPEQGNQCGACRSCWNASVDVSYHRH